MPRRLPEYCTEDVDRHGNVRVYLRLPPERKKIRLRGLPWSEEFMRAYAQAKAGAQQKTRSQVGTLRWLCELYFASPEFTRLDAETKRRRHLNLDAICAEPWRMDDPEGLKVGEQRVDWFTSKSIRVLRDRKAATPDMANAWVKDMRQVLKYALESDIDGVEKNVARDVPRLKSLNPGGHHSWSADEVRAFEERWPIGTKERLAFALLLYTAQRRGDVCRLGKEHLQDGWLVFTQAKNERNRPKEMAIPLLPQLKAIIDASPCGQTTFLTSSQGRAYSSRGFGKWFEQACATAGVPGRAHGLRKAAAAILAEKGCTAKEIQAITGHAQLAEVARYTAKADQRKLAAAAMAKMGE
jgi:integrase